LIEPSATIRHIQENTLIKYGFDVETASDFEKGLELIESEEIPRSLYDAFFIGWPARPSKYLDRVLSILSAKHYTSTPILILAHEDKQEAKEHASQKNNTIHVSWHEHKRCAEILSNLYSRLTNANFDTKTHIKPIRILFVDDSRTVRFKYKSLLRDNGYDVEVAKSASSGFKKATKSEFDIAIIDYFMPETNGDELCKQLLEDPRTNTVTTALITGTYIDYAIENSLKSGAVECMFKNESEDLFIARVDAMSRHIRTRKHIEEERKRLGGILHSVGDGVFGVDNEGNISFINPACLELLGFDSKDNLIGQSAHQLFHYADESGSPLSKEKCELQNAYKHGHTINGKQAFFWNKSGKPIPIEYTVYPFSVDAKRQGSVVAFRDISDRLSLENRLRWQADHDTLTKLANRRRFEKDLKREIDRLKRGNDCSALLYIDLDRFKYVNDTAGHSAGDQLLIEISQLLASRLRKADDLARLGGDEFAIILRGVTREAIKQTADDYRHLLEQYIFLHNDKQFNINASIGIAIMDSNTTDTETALSNADTACNIAKKRGRNQVHIYAPDIDAHEDKDLNWSLQINNALEQDLFLLHYQPVFNCKQLDNNLLNRLTPECNLQQLTSSDTQILEALLRLTDDKQEIIYPDAFLPTAERFNLMDKIDIWVVEHAISQLKQLQQNGYMGKLSINLSGQTISDPRVVDAIEHLIIDSKIDTSKVIFEFSEASFASTSLQTREMVDRMHNIGCMLSLDDFGSGFFSFPLLKQLPVDFIKIDSQLVQGANNEYNQAVIKSINSVAHSLNIKTIAKYVEDRQTLDFIIGTGIDHAQGFFLSRPALNPTNVICEHPAIHISN
jgi:diguanylate cyclase (GGDEF)-like protein/PAS domain S-box-containing protein